MPIFWVFLFLAGAAHGSWAQVVPVVFSGSGTNSFDGWTNLNSSFFSPGYSSFPGTGAWTNANGTTNTIRANATNSGDARLARLAGAPGGGGPFLAMESIYFGSTNQVTNALGGTLAVNETTPVAGLKTIVLQIQIGEAVGYDFVSPSGVPVLKINNTTNRIAATYPRYLVARYQNETFPSPETGLDEPVYVNTWAFQWNLTNTVTSFQIEFSAVTHAQVYALRLDQASVLQNYRVLVETPPSTNSLPPPALQLTSRGTPFFNGSQTTLTNTFRSDTNRSLQIEYNTNPTSTNWQVASPVATGTNGTFTVTLTNSGDVRTAWSQRMFFRARNSP